MIFHFNEAKLNCLKSVILQLTLLPALLILQYDNFYFVF